MQRHLTTPTESTFKSPAPSKRFEKQFASAMKFMVEQIGQRFQNQAIGGLQKKTVNKFEDAQVGNYASVFLKLAGKTRRKLLKQFSDDRVDQFTRDILNRSDKSASKRLYGKVENLVGISTEELLKTEGLSPEINALVLESAQWVKKLRDEAIESFTNESLRLMTQGEDIETILNAHNRQVKKRKNHAQFLARNQLQNFNSMSSKIRAQKLGITEAKWITAGDEDVRTCHKVRSGKTFELSKGLYSSCDGKWLLPGTDFNCRCTYEMIIPSD